jgi:hypothetical protein
MLKFGRWVVPVAAAWLGATPCGVHAETWDRLPTLRYADDDLAATARHQVVATGLRVGQVRITFEGTRWSDLRHRLGPLRIRRQGDAGDTEDWTCFTVAVGNNRNQIWLDGDELAGGEYIDGVTVYADTPWPLRECPLIDPGRGPVTLDNGLWIGATRASLLKRLGHPTAVRGASFIYDYSAPLHARSLGEGWANGRMIFELDANRVVRLAATKNTPD